MPKFKLAIAYAGTNYYGWQVQSNKPTIAQTMQDTYARIFNEQIRIVGVSRTDAGVHARGQVATVMANRAENASQLMFAWNNGLPDDIKITECQEVPIDHNPFQSIRYKVYHYHLLTRYALPFYKPYGWYLMRQLPLEKIEEALNVFIGTHNFRSFSSGDDRGDDTIRTVTGIQIYRVPSFQAYRIVINGSAFLRYMIRRMVGAAVEISFDPGRTKDELIDALNNPAPRQRLLKAPAHGLILHKIVYETTPEDTDEQTDFLV